MTTNHDNDTFNDRLHELKKRSNCVISRQIIARLKKLIPFWKLFQHLWEYENRDFLEDVLLLPKRSDIISMHIQCIMSAYSCTRDLFIWKFWMTKAKRDEMMRWNVAILSYFTNATHSKLIPSWIWEIKRESTKSETTMNSGAFMINYTRSKKVRIALFCWLHNKTFFLLEMCITSSVIIQNVCVLLRVGNLWKLHLRHDESFMKIFIFTLEINKSGRNPRRRRRR